VLNWQALADKDLSANLRLRTRERNHNFLSTARYGAPNGHQLHASLTDSRLRTRSGPSTECRWITARDRQGRTGASLKHYGVSLRRSAAFEMATDLRRPRTMAEGWLG
jgi:hypothetical protein